MELPFAGLHQLCVPLLARLDRLPAPQQDALGIAFGLTSGVRPERFLVGLAVLSLLSEAAEERPLLCLIDDAQWLDQSSSQVLAFVARRLAAESIVLVFAERESDELDALAGLPELPLEGLSDVDARELLGSVVSGPLDERIAEQLVAETHGNPLALLELPHGLSPAELAGGFALTARAAAAEPDRGELPPKSRASPRRQPAAAPSRRGRAARRSEAVVAGGRAPRSRARGGRTSRGCGPAHPRRTGHLSPPPPALGDLPRGAGARATERARRSGGSYRSRPRSRSPRVASRPGHARTGRGRCRRARALSRPGPSTRRPRRRSRIPRARRDADPGPRATRPP